MNARSIACQLLLALTAPLLLSCGGGGGSAEGGVGGNENPAVPVAAPSDTAAPQVTLSAPVNLATDLTGVVALGATASDNIAVTRVEFQVDGLAAGADDTAPFTASVNTADHAAGQHVVRARALDAAGNVSAWATATVKFGGGAAVPAGFTKNDRFITGLSQATAAAQATDGRLFIAEQGGAVRVFKAGGLLPQPFVRLAVDASGERGLIGIALHPDFPATPYVYLHHTTTPQAAGGIHNRISRFTAQGDTALPSSELVLVDLPPLSAATNHNGGALHFGTDGKLYVGVGENADPAQSQNLGSPLGKLLRFNDDGSIPADNPFFSGQQGLARAIWAYGLRNPFSFAVQPGTGRIYINDAGANTWEEINAGAAGANFGWPGSEGPDNAGAGVTAPLFAYKHSDAVPPGSGPGGFFTGFAIAGGTFYPASGPFAAPYRNNYFFADFVRRFVGRLDAANGNAAYAFASLADAPVDMLVGTDGALLVLGRTSVTRISSP
jgi:glucose/arabinose dehydrogenase